MGNAGCTPPSDAKWTLPLAAPSLPRGMATSSSQWDSNPTKWNIPLYGLTASLINNNPTIAASSARTTPNGNYCLISAPGPFAPCNTNTCYPEIQGCQQCDASQGEIFTAYDFINDGLDQATQYSQSYNTTCTTTCSRSTATQTCSLNGVPSVINGGWDPDSLASYNSTLAANKYPSLPPAATCQYTIVGSPTDPFPGTMITDLAKLSPPDSWMAMMTARYSIYAFLAAWNASVYGDNMTSFHVQCDFTDPQSISSFVTGLVYSASVPQILAYVQGVTQQYVNTFITNLAVLGQLHSLTYGEEAGPTFGTTSNAPAFGMLYYDFSFIGPHVVGASAEPTAQEMSTTLTNLTTESPGSIGVSFAPVPQTFQYPPSDLTSNPYYIFVDVNAFGTPGAKAVYNINVVESELMTIAQARQTVPGGDFYVVGRIFPLIITKLSVVLSFWYNYLFPELLTSPNYQTVCSRISADTSQLPQQCYTNTCGPGNPFTGQCKDSMISLCSQASFIPSTIFPRISTKLNMYYATNQSTTCQCYNTRLRPTIGGDADRIPGMCFTGQCTGNPSLVNAFGLTDQVCATYCPTVYGWLTNGINGVSVRQYIDTARYELLCGTSYVPTGTTRVSVPIAVIGLVASVFLVGVTYMIFRSIPATLVTAVLLCGASVFLAMLLNGQSSCNPNILEHNNECHSALFPKLTLPLTLCPNPIACECISASQCTGNPPPGGGQTCISGVCVDQ